MSTLSDRLARLRSAGTLPPASRGFSGKNEESRRVGQHENSNTRDAENTAGPIRLAARRSAGSLVPNDLRNRLPPGSGWRRIGDFVWERRLDYPAVLHPSFRSGFVLPSGTAAEIPIFYDLETTGLSGGAGNTAFLIGVGYQSEDVFTVIQIFLADYPGEAAMLERYEKIIEEDRPQISYNGRSFDSQVLKTRFLLNRMPPPFRPQVDLLYPARRLWGTLLPNVALGTLEKEVLEVFREDDLPGREAPDAWFSWLKGNTDRIEGVFRHNAEDIVSLAKLAAKMEDWGNVEPETFTAALGGTSCAENARSAGGESRVQNFRSLEDGGCAEESRNAGECAGSPEGLPAGRPISPRGMARQWSFGDSDLERRWLEAGWAFRENLCGRELALRLRREGNFSAAGAVWKQLNDLAEGRDFRAAVELAKEWEHRRKNPAKALEVLSGLDALFLKERQCRELAHRRRRLQAAMERTAAEKNECVEK